MFVERDKTIPFVKADFESVEEAGSAKEIEANAESLRKTYRNANPLSTQLNIEIGQVRRNKSSISNLDQDPSAVLVVKANSRRHLLCKDTIR